MSSSAVLVDPTLDSDAAYRGCAAPGCANPPVSRCSRCRRVGYCGAACPCANAAAAAGGGAAAKITAASVPVEAAHAPPSVTSAPPPSTLLAPPAAAAAAATAAGAAAHPLLSRLPPAVAAYFARWAGTGLLRAPPLASVGKAAMSCACAFVGMLALAGLHYRVSDGASLVLSTASFAASAVLIYAAPAAPMSQPRAVIGGQVLSAFVGVALRQLCISLPGWPSGVFLIAPLAVALAVALMMLTGTLHPPGGATAYLAVAGDAAVLQQGWLFIIMPALTSSLILVAIGVLLNNLEPTHAYPAYWLY